MSLSLEMKKIIRSEPSFLVEQLKPKSMRKVFHKLVRD